MITLTAIRTDCITKEQREVSIELNLEQGDFGSIIKITKGGVTGYESFYYDSFLERWDKDKAWCACAGTKGVWDRLEISSSEMVKAIDFFDGILKTVER